MDRATTFNTIIGFGAVSTKRHISLRLAYACYSIVALCMLSAGSVHYATKARWSGRFDLDKAAALVEMVRGFESLFSALFSIYCIRMGKYEAIKEHWQTNGANKLLIRSTYTTRRWLWLIAILLCFLACNTAVIWSELFSYMGLFIMDETRPKHSLKLWELCILLSSGSLATFAYFGAMYTYYHACVLLYYAWQGFCLRIKDLGRDTSKIWKDKIAMIADVYDQLAELTAHFNSLFGLYVLVLLLSCIPELFVQLYFLNYWPAAGLQQGELFMWITVEALCVLIMYSGSLVNIGASGAPEALYDCLRNEQRQRQQSAKEMSSQELTETSILLMNLRSNSINISVCGIFNISKNGLIGVFSLLVTAYSLFYLEAGKTGSCTGGNSTVLY